MVCHWVYLVCWDSLLTLCIWFLIDSWLVVVVNIPSGYDEQFTMERSTMFKFGKPSISMIRAIYFPWRTVTNNQMV